MRYWVLFGNRGYCMHAVKFSRHIDAVKFAHQRFKSGYDFIQIDILEV